MEMQIQNPTIPHLYLSAFHWAFAQFTPSNTKIYPQNVTEEAVNIVILFCGFIIFSSIVGSVTTTLTLMRANAAESVRQEKMFRDYMSTHKVSPEVRQQIAAH